MNDKNAQPEHKHFKRNSYEIEVEEKDKPVHLKKAPEPHTHGHIVTEDIE